MTVKKPTGSAQSARQENKGTQLLGTFPEEKQQWIQKLAENGIIDTTVAVDVSRLSDILDTAIQFGENRRARKELDNLLVEKELEVARLELDEQKDFNSHLKLRLDALNVAAFAYQNATPLGEAGELTGTRIVGAAKVIESYLSGNKADGNQD